MDKMSHSDAGRLGAEKTHRLWIERYEQNPKKCVTCDKALSYEKRKNKFCDHSCAAKHNNLGVKRFHGNGESGFEQKTQSVALNSGHGLGSGKPGPKPKPKVCCKCLHCDQLTTNKKYCSWHCGHDHREQLRFAEIESGNGRTPSIRRYLLKTRGHRCELCGISEWQGQVLPMIMDHIDGNSENNQLDNLRLVCSNCDSLLPTWKGRNAGNGRHARRQRYKQGKSF